MKKLLVLGALSLLCCGSESFGAQEQVITSVGNFEQVKQIPGYDEAGAAYNVLSRQCWAKEESDLKLSSGEASWGWTRAATGIRAIQSCGEWLMGTDLSQTPETAPEVLRNFLIRVRDVDLGPIKMGDIKPFDHSIKGRNFHNLIRAMKIRCSEEDVTFTNSDELRAFDRLAKLFRGRGAEIFPTPINVSIGTALIHESVFQFPPRGEMMFKRLVDHHRFVNVMRELNIATF